MKKILLSVFAIGLMLIVAMPVLAKSDNASEKSNQSCTTIQSGKLCNSEGDVITTGFDEWGYNYQGRFFLGGYCDAYRDAAWCQPYKDDQLSMKWNDAWLSNKDCDGDGKLDRHLGYDSYIGSGAWLTNHQSGSYEDNCHWDVSGDWTLDFAGGTDNREFRNLVQDSEGNVTGDFWWLNGSNWEYGGTLVGTISGDTLQLHYDRAPILYTGDFEGTVGNDVITDGTFSDSHGNHLLWAATGTSEKVCDTCDWNYFVKIVAVPQDATNVEGMWYTADQVKIGPVIWGEFAIIQEVSNDTCTGDHGLLYKGEAPTGFGFYKP
jgi:hypothetical protein